MGNPTLIAEPLPTLNYSPTLMLLILAIIFVLGWPLEWVPIVGGRSMALRLPRD